MKKIIKNLIFLSVIIFFLICHKNYSFCISSVQDSHLHLIHGRTNNYYFDKDLILTNQNVKMTQDDNFYYFDIEADIIFADHIKGVMTANPISVYDNMRIRSYMGVTNQFVSNCMQPLLFKENNFTDERVREICNYINISGHQLNEHILYFGDKKIAQTHIEGTGNEFFGGNITYWRSNYGNYFYFPHALSLYDGDYLGRTYPNGDYIPNVNEMLISHDGVEILSQSSFLKNWVVENNKVNDATIGCKTKIKVEKTKMDRYKYLAYGGLLYCKDYNHKSRDNTYEETLNAAFSMTGTFNIATYSNCKHSYEYNYEKESDFHIKKCRKCEWTIKESHNYIYEYDGIKNNMCECGKCLKVKCHFEINDDYNNIIEKEVMPYSKIEVEEYKEKEGYEFLYYEKYERNLYTDENLNYSYSTATKSTLIKDVLIATMSTLDNIIKDKSIIYKCVYTPIRLKVNYYTDKGLMANNNISMSVNYIYWNLKLEKPKGNFGNEVYFDGYLYLQNIIKSEIDIRRLIYKQDQIFDLKACFNYPEYGRSESDARGEPKEGGGLKYKEDEKIIKNNSFIEKELDVNKIKNFKEDFNYNNSNSNRREYIYKENNININKDNELFKMSLSDYKKLLDKIGLNISTLSNTKGKVINKKNNFLSFVFGIFINRYVLITFALGLFILIIFYIIIKYKNKKTY